MSTSPKSTQKKAADRKVEKTVPKTATKRARALEAEGVRSAQKKEATDTTGAAAQAAARAERRKLIQALIKMAMKKLEKGPEKATVTDLIRLMSLEKEIGEEGPSKIVVEWIDPRTGEPWKPME